MAVKDNLLWFPYSIMVFVAFVGFVTPFLLRENYNIRFTFSK